MRILFFIVTFFIASLAKGQQLFHAHNRVAPVAGCGYDTDACAYFTRLQAVGYTPTSGEKSAISTFITGLKSASIYTKIHEMYLIVGTAGAHHALGFKNVSDLTYSGTLNHDAGGMDPDGGRANTGIAANTIGVTSNHLAYYSVENNTVSGGDYATNMAAGEVMGFYLYESGNTFFFSFNNGTRPMASAGSDTRGLYVGSRETSNDVTLYRNGTSLNSVNAAPGTPETSNLMIGGGSWHSSGTKKTCFVSMGSGLTSSEVGTFTTLVNNLQTALGRNTF
jgi:hypothetical protein